MRTYERSDRVYKAMILRGYGHAAGSTDEEFEAGRSDAVLLAGLLLVAAAFVATEMVLRWGGG